MVYTVAIGVCIKYTVWFLICQQNLVTNLFENLETKLIKTAVLRTMDLSNLQMKIAASGLKYDNKNEYPTFESLSKLVIDLDKHAISVFNCYHKRKCFLTRYIQKKNRYC